jgi:hypothetical protein
LFINEKKEMMRVLHEEQEFAGKFIRYMLERNIKIEAGLVDQLFNSSEKRLARALLILARYGKEGEPETVVAKISQETLAELVGTTRSRVNFKCRFEGSHGCRCGHPRWVPNDAAFAQKAAGTQKSEHGLFALRIYDSQFGVPRLKVKNVVAWIILGKENLPFFELNNPPRYASVREITLDVERLCFF